MYLRVFFFLGLLTCLATAPSAPAPKANLSEYGFFTGPLADLNPTRQVFPYEVNAPLFSDYAEKARFVYLPEGTKMQYQANVAFELPPGAVLIKQFFYYNDASHPEKGRRLLETRLLLREKTGWKALTYVWNEDQTDAHLEIAGAELPVSWIDAKGNKQALHYQVPNLNQCKGCHSYDGVFTPIGLTARQLNRITVRAGNPESQLASWHKSDILELPGDFDASNAPKLSQLSPYAEFSGELNAAARAYLDANCAHCHNPHGPASTSGLFLEYNQTDKEKWGVYKSPVAAGRGSGKLRYAIVPGKPQESILCYRMESDDPGIRMPELGRQLAHKEGIALVKNWIRNLNDK